MVLALYRMAQKKVVMPLEIAYHRYGMEPTRDHGVFIAPFCAIILVKYYYLHVCGEFSSRPQG